MYTKHPPQKRNKTYREKKLSLVAPIKTKAGEQTDVFLWKARRQENWEISNTSLHQKMLFLFMTIWKLPSVTQNLIKFWNEFTFLKISGTTFWQTAILFL